MPSEEKAKLAIQLIERVGLPIILLAAFAYVLSVRTSTLIDMQKEYADKERAMCEQQLDVQEQQLAVLRELRDAMRLVRPPAGGQ